MSLQLGLTPPIIRHVNLDKKMKCSELSDLTGKHNVLLTQLLKNFGESYNDKEGKVTRAQQYSMCMEGLVSRVMH